MVDPYEWLGVPKGLRPPTHYQLLGLGHQVSDPAAIRAGANLQFRKLLPYMTGADALEADRVWAEIEEARDILLDPARRATYDSTVPLTVAAAASAEAPEPAAEPAAPDIAAFEEVAPVATADPLPWWRPVTEPARPVAQPWWTQPLPVEVTPPPPATQIQPFTLAMPAAAAPRPANPKRRRTNPAVYVLAALLLAGGIVGGAYYASHLIPSGSPEPKVEPRPREVVQAEPPRPPKPQPPAAGEPVLADDPLPADFADQLRPRTFAGHTGPVSAVAVSGSGSLVATAGADGTVRLWTVAGDRSAIRHTFRTPVVGLAWADQDCRLVAADGSRVRSFDSLRNTPPRTFDSPHGALTSLAVDPAGKRALAGLNDGYVRLWDLATGRPDERPAADRGAISALDISPDGTQALVAVAGGPVQMWALSGLRRAFEWDPPPGGALAVRFSPDGQLAAAAGADGTAAVYDLVARREISRLTGHTGRVTGVAWQSGGRQLVTVGADGTARLWHAATGQPIRWVQTLNGKGTSVAVDPGNRFVLVGTATGIVHLFPLPRIKGEALAGPAARVPAEPLPAPDPEAIAAAVETVRMELRKQYRYNRPEDVSVLADNLRRRAAAESVADPMRYGLLQEARTLAVKAGDATTALQAVADLAAWFDVDELAETAATLTALPADTDPRDLVAHGLAVAERAEMDARPEVVERVLRRLPDGAPGLPEKVAARLSALRKRSAAAGREWRAVAQALGVLVLVPDDPAANLTVGQFLCLARQDWTAGLPHLVKGSDPRLIDAARLDRSNPTDPKARHRIGEVWFAFATDARDQRARRAYLGRARAWFEREQKANLEVIDAIKVRGRLEEIATLDVPGADPTSRPLFTPIVVRRAYNTTGADVRATEWVLESGSAGKGDGVYLPPGEPALRSRFGLAPGGRLTLSLRPDGREVRIFLAGREAAFAGSGSVLRIVIERKDEAVTLTATADGGSPVVQTVELPAANRGPTELTMRLTGTPARPGGTMLDAAMARGPASLPLPKPE